MRQGRSIWCCQCCAGLVKANENASYEELRDLATRGKLPDASAVEKCDPAPSSGESKADLSKLRGTSTAQPGIKLRDEATKELARIAAMSPDIVKARRHLNRLEQAFAKRIEKYASTDPTKVARIEMEAAECRRQGDAILESMQAPAPAGEQTP